MDVNCMRSIPRFAASLLICFGAAALGGLITSSSVNSWYAALNKPAFSPPNWLFAPVWNFLYLLMAVYLYRLLTSGKQAGKRAALAAFALQLALNVAWSAVFFGLRSPAGGIFIIIMLLAAILAALLLGRRIVGHSAGLLLPYLAWVCFAGYLNFQFWVLNR